MTCSDPYFYTEPVDINQAITNMQASDFVVIVELYQESICLLEARLTGSLSSHCNCSDQVSWNSFEGHHYEHCANSHHHVSSDPDEVLADVDFITQDDRSLYAATLERFQSDVRNVEREYNTRILCKELPVLP